MSNISKTGLGALAGAVLLGTPFAYATDITIKRKLDGPQALNTQSGEQIEVSFADGALLVVGAQSAAQIDAPDGVLSSLALEIGVFEVATATDGTLSFQSGGCSTDLINGAIRVAISSDRSLFMFQSGSAVLIRSGSGITNLTTPGTAVEIDCYGDGTASAIRDVTPDEIAVASQLLGQPDEIEMVDLVKGGAPGTNPRQVNASTGPGGNLITDISLPLSVSPTIIVDPSFPPLPLSVAPGIGGDNCGLECFDGGGGSGFYYWNGPGGTTGARRSMSSDNRPGTGPTPNGQNPSDLSDFTATSSSAVPLPSDVYANQFPDSSRNIRFQIDPVDDGVTAASFSLNERFELDPSTPVSVDQLERLAVTRLPVDGTNKDYVTFTYRNQRFAVFAGTFAPDGTLETSGTDNGFDMGSYASFRLTSGTVEPLSGMASGIGVDVANSAYVEVASMDLALNPVDENGTPMGPGVSASLSLSLDGGAGQLLSLFGSARSDDAYYVDLATQGAGATQVSMASGQAVAGLNAPASVKTYGSYLDWGILRGRLNAGTKTAELLPTPWVAGKSWSPADLDSFKGTARYNGHTLGNAVDASGARTVFGTYSNSWDFSTGTGTVQMDFDGANYAGTTARTAGTVAFTGNVAGANRTGALSGQFYGNSQPGVAPDALGGTFAINGTKDAPYAARGIMAAGKE